MPIVFGAIAPHGFPIIPELSDDAEGALATRHAMHELGRLCAEAGVEAIVIAGPHGVRVEGMVCLADVARGAGTLFWNGRSVEMNIPMDGQLTAAIARTAGEQGVPIARAGYAGNRWDQSCIPLDWGVMTPLWFLGHGRHLPGKGHVLAEPPERDEGPPVVIVTPSRSVPRTTLITFGRAVADACAESDRRIAFVASCDWGHRHKAEGPYGYHEASARVDGMVVDAITSGDLHALLKISDQDAADAAIDGLWQALMLAGVTERVPMRGELLCYEAPSYYGMIVASYVPVSG